MKLILPSIEFKDSFLLMAKDLKRENHWWDEDPSELQKNFSDYLQKLEAARDRLQLGPQEVPYTEYWILEEDIIVGRLKLNHELNEQMKTRGGHIGYGISSIFRKKGLATKALAAALQIAKEMGLKDILLTCDDDNEGSIYVIERNGGLLKDKIIAPGRMVFTRRYSINL
jgi:predicted acetyltransferase